MPNVSRRLQDLCVRPLIVRSAVFTVLVFFVVSSHAQNQNLTNLQVAGPADAIGPGDLVELNVAYCPELTHSFRVGADGLLSLPLLQHPLNTTGETATQLAQRIEKELRDSRQLVDPVVSANVLESHSRPISVVGAVNHPLTFQAEPGTTLIDAIARAGGTSPSAGGTIIVTSFSTGNVANSSEIPVATLLSGSNPQANIALHGGEKIRVLEAHKYFVAGNVKQPGMYSMQNDSAPTVIKALAVSSGLDHYSSKTAYIYRLNARSAKRDEIEVPLKAILKRRAPDVELVADDILYVPANDGQRLAAQMLTQFAGFGQTAEAALLITR